MGFFDKDVKPHDVIVDSTPEWESQTEEERALSARAMECYAGMVEGIDRNCGKVIDYLKSTGEYDSASSFLSQDQSQRCQADENRYNDHLHV